MVHAVWASIARDSRMEEDLQRDKAGYRLPVTTAQRWVRAVTAYSSRGTHARATKYCGVCCAVFVTISRWVNCPS